jgi:DNA mismatch repair protein MutS
VARLAGIPQEVIKRAKEILSNLEINSLTGESFSKLAKTDFEKLREKQLDLFIVTSHPVIEELKKIDLDKMTPLEAMLKIREWQKKMQKSK